MEFYTYIIHCNQQMHFSCSLTFVPMKGAHTSKDFKEISMGKKECINLGDAINQGALLWPCQT